MSALTKVGLYERAFKETYDSVIIGPKIAFLDLNTIESVKPINDTGFADVRTSSGDKLIMKMSPKLLETIHAEKEKALRIRVDGPVFTGMNE